MVESQQQSVRDFLLWESFDRANRKLFFGRDREVKRLYDKTFASNLLLLYGPSGAGKTSLVRCGLGNMFEKSDWYPIYIRKGDDIIKSLSQALRDASESPEKLRNNSIREKIHELFLEKFRPIFLIFDQFEELFILGNREEQNHFFSLLIDLMNANFQCKIILSIKEDYIADLDIYEESVPVLFYNRMRVERMRTEQLEKVVTGMTSHMHIDLGSPDDGPVQREQIIHAIFSKVRDDVNRIDLGELQIFMDELYTRDELRRVQENNPERRIRFDQALIKDTDYVDVVISRRLQKRLEDLDLKFRYKAQKDRLPHLILRELVTELETKRSRTVEEIEKNLFQEEKILPNYIEECIQTLVDTGILRNLAATPNRRNRLVIEKKHKIEIVHDNLAKKLYPLLFSEEQNIIRVKNFIAIQFETFVEAGVKLSKDDLEYIQPYLAQIRKDLPEEQINFVQISRREVKKRDLRLGFFLVGLSLFLLLSTVAAVWQWSSSSRKSAANNISAQALGALAYDRTQALRLAEIALDKDPENTLANNVLNDVLINVFTFPFYQKKFEINSQEIDRISDLDVSNNGRYLLAGSLDGGLYLLRLSGNKKLQRLKHQNDEQHQKEITDVDFIKDESYLKYGFLTSSKDSTVKLWKIDNDTLVTLMNSFTHSEPILAVSYQQMGPNVNIFTAGEDSITQWRYLPAPDTPYVENRFALAHTNAFEVVAFGGQHYLLTADRDTTFKITPLFGSMTSIVQRVPGESAIISMDYEKSANKFGQFVAGLEDGRLITWPLNASFLNGVQPIDEIENYQVKEAHTQAIKDVTFIKDGTQILTSSKDKSAKLWSADLQILKTFLGHNDGVQTITSAEEGEFIYTGGEDKTIKKWKLDMIPVETVSLVNKEAIAYDYSFSAQRLLLRSSNNDKEELHWLTFKDNRLKEDDEFKLDDDQITANSVVALSPFGEQLLFAHQGESYARLVDDRGELITTLAGPPSLEIKAITFSQDGNFALTASNSKTYVWEGIGKKAPKIIDSIPRSFHTAALIFTGNQLQLLGAVTGDNIAYFYTRNYPSTKNTDQFTLVNSIVHTDDVLSVALTPDGLQFLTGSKDNSFFFYSRKNLDSDFITDRKQRHTSDVSVVAFSPGKSPQRFLTASLNGKLRLWNINGKEEKSYIDHGFSIISALFLSDTIILTLGADGSLKLWNTEEMEKLILPGEDKPYSFTPEEKKAFSKE